MFKWAQRDKRLALVMLVDLVLALLVGAVLLLQVMSPSQPEQGRNEGATPDLASPTVATGPVYSLTLPPLPTVNPTALVALPNQGQSDAPLPPAGLLPGPTFSPIPTTNSAGFTTLTPTL